MANVRRSGAAAVLAAHDRSTAEAIRMADEAKTMAAAAMARHETHEAVCAQRYGTILSWLKAMSGIIGVAASGLIIALWQVVGHLPALK